MSDVDLDDIKRRMEGSINSLKTEFMGLRAGRASTGMLEPIMVDAYGSKMPMTQVGNISAPEPRLLTVTVWDASLTSAVEKAIRESDLGLNPMAEGTLIGCRSPICRKNAGGIWSRWPVDMLRPPVCLFAMCDATALKARARCRRKALFLRMSFVIWRQMFRSLPMIM